MTAGVASYHHNRYHYHTPLLLPLFILAHAFICSSSSFINIPKYTAPTCERCRFSASSDFCDTNYTNTVCISPCTLNHDDNHRSTKIPYRMVPLSAPPLLLLQSSTPILSWEECSLLSRYFEQLTNKSGCDCEFSLDKMEIDKAKALLQDVCDIIDTVTNCPRHDGEAPPRYVRYDTTTLDEAGLSQNLKTFGKTLLPDGLHVDTNNGKLFRHITAILYLTDNYEVGSSVEADHINGVIGGGTTFPLAVPIDQQYNTHNVIELRDAAKRLLNDGIHHTKGDVDENDKSDGRIVENAALGVFLREVNECTLKNQYLGIRVMPMAGKLIYFHNVDDDGEPDPTSFHGGEELITALDGMSLMVPKKTKSILVFFKEIPLQAFVNDGKEGFAKKAAKSRLWTRRMYY